jgi:hypothetical protein
LIFKTSFENTLNPTKKNSLFYWIWEEKIANLLFFFSFPPPLLFTFTLHNIFLMDKRSYSSNKLNEIKKLRDNRQTLNLRPSRTQQSLRYNHQAEPLMSRQHLEEILEYDANCLRKLCLFIGFVFFLNPVSWSYRQLLFVIVIIAY